MKPFPLLSVFVLSAGVTVVGFAAEPGEPLVSEAVIDAPVRTVWDLFTTREGMESWAVARAAIELRIGATWRTSYTATSTLQDDTVIETEVLAFDPGRMLAARTTRPPAGFPFRTAIRQTWYVIYLEPLGDARTRVVHRMFGFTEDEESRKMRAFFERGNAYELRQLAAHVSSTAAAQPGTQFPDAVRADPAHYSVSFENELVRFLRVKYGPGERSTMHAHAASCVIFLTDQTFNFTLPDGTTEPASVPAGALGCGDANIHLPENVAADAAEFIMVEFKNRETFRH